MVGVIMFIIFLMVDISVVGIYAFVYSDLKQYNDGMIFGVHIPREELQNEEVQNLTNKFAKSFRRFNLWNFLISTLLCGLCFINFTLFMLLWFLWLVEYIALGYYMTISPHRKLYDIKMKNHWVIEGNTHVVQLDTVTSAISDKPPISHWWNAPAFVSVIVLLLPPRIREYLAANPVQWIIPGIALFVTILFWLIHLWFIRRNTIAYSEDSQVNSAVNRMEQRTWSAILLGTNYTNLIGWIYLAVRIMMNQWLYDGDYGIYIILQLLPAIMIIIGIFYMRNKRKEILSMDPAPLTVDDDEYWKKGWYYNPNDPHFLVKDRMNSTNYSTNMAKPAAKVMTIAIAIVTTVSLLFLFTLLFSLENTKITFRMDASEISIAGAMYDSDFEMNEIQSVKVINQLPYDDFTRTNGGATDKFLVGHFTGKETGKCMLFVYRDYEPILEIKLKDKTIFVNSKDKNDVKEWYKELTGR